MRSAMDVTTNFPNPWPGGEWRPRDIMQMELIACHALLSLAANYRAEYLRDFFELGKANLAPAVEGAPLAYLIPAGQGRDENVSKMIGALIEQGVEVHRLDKELHATRIHQVIKRTSDAGSGTRPALPSNTDASVHPPETGEVPAGSYIIFLNQPYRRNVLALFEPQAYPDRVTATGEAERPYDVAGWTLPMQMGIDALAVTSISEPPGERKLTLIKHENEVRRDFALPPRTGDKSPIANPVKAGIRVAIYQDTRTGNMDEGWTRYVFDTFNVPYESLREPALTAGNLKSRFDVIVLPSEQTRNVADGDAAEDTRGLGNRGYQSLSRFVEAGGTLICFDRSCGPLVKQWKLPVRNVLEGVRSTDFYCPGSVLRLEVDTTQGIARSMSRDTDAYFVNSSAFEPTDPASAVKVIARYANDELLRSGWLRGEDRLNGKIALAEVPLGQGRIVLFAFRPQHRGQTWGTFPFIWNAINLGK
jgi:hypothetical protein